MSKLVTLTRSKLDKVNWEKVVALIMIEVHARDSIDKLAKAGCTAPTDFEWVSQLRFYWDQEQDDCVVKQVLSVFSYGYEYQGNNGRLVVTPLTDRCYMTLGAAMFTRRGGNPLGPAGTGKTETVKDFGKALARYVIVFNCSDGVDYKMTAKMFSGLAQDGRLGVPGRVQPHHRRGALGCGHADWRDHGRGEARAPARSSSKDKRSV